MTIGADDDQCIVKHEQGNCKLRGSLRPVCPPCDGTLMKMHRMGPMHPCGGPDDQQRFLNEPRRLAARQRYARVGRDLSVAVEAWNKQFPDGEIPIPDRHATWETHRAGEASLHHAHQDVRDRRDARGGGAGTPG